MIQTYKVRRKKDLLVLPWNIGGSKYLSWSGVGSTRAQLIARLSEVDTVKLVGLLDPASVAWELLPYSFVVDWFIPIGQYLAARALPNALTGVFVTTKTRLVECHVTGLADSDNGIVKNVYMAPPGRTDATDLTVTRTVSTTLTVPLPTWKTLDKVASWQHAANAVALLSQRFWRGKD
jgi:hypothetical protein